MNVSIEGLSRGEMLALSDRQDRYFWSGAVASLLADAGIAVGNGLRDADASVVRVVLRETPSPFASFDTPHVFEGPLHSSTLQQLEIRARLRETRSMEIQSTPGGEATRLASLQLQVRAIPEVGNQESSSPFPQEIVPSRFQRPAFEYQVFDAYPSDCRPLFTTTIDDAVQVVGLIKSSSVILGFPLFDIGVVNLTTQRLSAGYYSTLDGCRVDGLIREIFTAHLGVEMPEHPRHRSPCLFTIRHDLDRPITDQVLARLLDTYGDLGFKSTWSIRPELLPSQDQVATILANGHEVNVHSSATSLDHFRRDCDLLWSEFGVEVVGFTCHGGRGSPGHLGTLHNDWALESGLRYGEVIGGFRTDPLPFVRVECGIPVATSLMLHAPHVSFDRSTKPDDHYGTTVRRSIEQRIEQGSQIILMNHPDLHSDAFIELVGSLADEPIHAVTLRDAAEIGRIHHEEFARGITATESKGDEG